MSLKMTFIRFLVKQMSMGMFDSDKIDVEKIRAKLAKAYSNHKVEKGVTKTLETCAGVEVSFFTPDKMTSEHIVYYVHGGGLVTGDRDTAGPYSSQLALAMGCRVVSCSYRLAPEDPFPAGFDDSWAVYKHLVRANPDSKVSLIGESGGAYLSLVLAMRARDEGYTLPSSVVLNSVVADMSGKIVRPDSPKETTVTPGGLNHLAKMYAPGLDLAHPYISPILGDFKSLPPSRVIYDEDELLAIDSIEVYKKLLEAGVECELESYKGCFHAFTTVGKDSPESKRELKLSTEFMTMHFQPGV